MFGRRQNRFVTETTVQAATNRFGSVAGLFGFLVSAFVVAIAAASLASAAEENYQVAHGLGVYLGILPAGIVRGHPEWHAEGAMHGGAPRGRHQYHIVIAIFDAKTGARIEKAQVTANVSGLGNVGTQNIELEPMLIAGTVTYGNFVELPGYDRYDIKLDITVPGREPAPVRIDFTYQHVQ